MKTPHTKALERAMRAKEAIHGSGRNKKVEGGNHLK